MADPRPFLRHMYLAGLWCRYNAQRGTERQVLRVMRQLTVADLERMLTERSVTYEEAQGLDAYRLPGRQAGRYQACAHSSCTHPARVGFTMCAGHAPYEGTR